MNLLKQTINSISKLDYFHMEESKKRLDSLIKPVGSLGKLEDICIKLSGIYQSKYFDVQKKAIIAFAADHGVYEEGVSPVPQAITKIQIPNYVKGVSGVGVLSKFAGAKVVAVDVGINCDEKLEGVLDYKIRKGTDNMSKGPSMSKEEAIKSIEIGIEIANNLIDEGYKVLGIGEMGIGNTTPSTAIISVFGDFNPKDITGMGCGLDSNGIVHKANVIEKSIKLNCPDKKDALDVLSKVGGFEIGSMAGVILAASSRRVPVVIDGFISYASALIAYNLCPLCKDYIIASHFSAEPASQKALSLLGLDPMLNMNMRLGEGSGAALAFNIIDAANYMYENMLTFEEANMNI
ncbi:nicotinate-nucleotide--dimethylbenzimidazole phosphoribosyltransferase [Alkalithermobacter paradoxus]|uniref:Nicotinate-nucleotide--dimethylbenzimidazole phosphoribosyltransferase n=1 Tax=Alkalithermobacter paradoxus TaxID=29349 RepID=A0A1V4I7P6_9FIRM|nr:nicotinate-nucleotide--dimethylbenzimidazole phosphoribosyltransferase [[Clostridium] thermoalcaliphilum]